jgi:hypothetical protein
MSWRVAPAVLAIFRQADLQAPSRNKASDGTVSSAKHRQQNPNSDHDPDSAGWVYAGDLTDDDASGIDCREIARQIVARKDRRVKYLISEGRIVSSYSTRTRPAWQWGPYSGPNGHFKHLHVSVRKEWRGDTSPWWVMPSTSIAHDNGEFVMASKAELEQVVDAAVLRITGGVRDRDADGKVIDKDGRNVSNADVFTAVELLRAEVAALRAEVKR